MRIRIAMVAGALFTSCINAVAVDAVAPKTFQSKTCIPWDRTLHRMLGESEQFHIHSPELRAVVRAEAFKLKERCLRDISMASLNRYVLLTKLLSDDEADEVEGFD
ncbi:hypothetical protein AB4Z40_31290 [Bosea sp. 2YAB26]|jgi:hypothetical protein|uniref:hypothetical protein n=1 Tax=Bosea sp. 2YAB26 TaxID=3237478 RepID=UPI003F8E658A